MALLYRKNNYTKKDGTPVSEDVLTIKMVNAEGEGMTTKDCVIGMFKFEPSIKELEIKKGEKAGQKFKKGDGIFEPITPVDEDKLNKFKNIKLDFTAAVNRYEQRKINWQQDIIAFSIQPFIGAKGKKVSYEVEIVKKLSDEVYETVRDLRAAKVGWLDQVPPALLNNEAQTIPVKEAGVPYWALVCPEDVLTRIQTK